jgi:hypothetical protein
MTATPAEIDAVDDRRVTDVEASVFAALLASHYERNGRNPSDAEIDLLCAVAKYIVAHGSTALH